MAIALVATDNWLQHLEFTGGQRQTPFGPVDGMFYGTMATVGDMSGGNLTLNGRLSAERKEDWVYVVGGTHARVNTAVDPGIIFEQVNTGPLIPTTVTGIFNPTFEYGGQAILGVNNAVSFVPTNERSKIHGMPIFGDKRIDGILLMYAVGFETNIDAASYSASIWGWIIRYQSFFRGVSPSVG